MSSLKVGFDLDDFSVRLSKAEENVRIIERESTEEKFREVKSYDHLVRTEKSLWNQHEVIEKLSNELFGIKLEIRAKGMKVPEKKLDGLSKRISDALATMVGAIRRLSEQKNALYKELETRSRENYKNWLNALPGDIDEGC